MPVYEYECLKCGHTFTREQSIKAAPLKRCPVCRGKVERLISAGVNFIFKGSGFYATDYRSGEYAEKAKKEAESAKSASGKKSDSVDKSAKKKPDKTPAEKKAVPKTKKKKK